MDDEANPPSQQGRARVTLRHLIVAGIRQKYCHAHAGEDTAVAINKLVSECRSGFCFLAGRIEVCDVGVGFVENTTAYSVRCVMVEADYCPLLRPDFPLRLL